MAVLLERLDDEDRTAVEAALQSSMVEVQHVQIADVLQAAGHDVSCGMVAWHRRRKCRCG